MLADLRDLLKKRTFFDIILVCLSSVVDFATSFVAKDFDRYMGSPSLNSISKRNHGFSKRYMPTRRAPFLRLLHDLRLDTGMRLVDFGCGKGHLLRIAEEFGFRNTRGIEFCENFVSRARKNCSADILHLDFSDYEISDNDRIFFFYDPSEGAPLLQTFSNIAASLRASPRNAVLIYHNNWIKTFPSEWLEALNHPLVHYRKYWGNQFYILDLNRR